MHDRQIVRDDAVARMIAAAVAAGNVEASRVLPWPSDKLPGVAVYTGDQRHESLGGPEPNFRTETELVIEVDVDQALETDPKWEIQRDDLCDAIERALLNDPAWVAQYEKILGIETVTGQSADGARPTASAVITITVQYTTTFAPTVGDDLKTIRARWDMASPRNDPQTPTGPDGQIDAEDELQNLEQ